MQSAPQRSIRKTRINFRNIPLAGLKKICPQVTLPHSMDLQQTRTSQIPPVRITGLLGLLCLFFLICFGLGYPTLNRYDPRQTPGLSDVQSYAALVTGTPLPGPSHLKFRVLIPWIARPFYLAAKGHLSTWDPALFALLIAESLFVAATALLIVVLGTRQLGNYAIALAAALLYLLNFAIPNLRLVGLVDAGEGFFLLALLWSASRHRLWCLPLLAIFGALTKESFVPFLIAFTAVWWLVSRKQLDSSSSSRSAIWILSSWVLGFLTLTGIQWSITGRVSTPIEFAASLHGNHAYFHHFFSSLADRNLWYIFIWLLPVGLPHLSRLPKSWLIPTASAAIMAFILDGYYGGAPGTVGRALFSVAGPLLSISAPSFLCAHSPTRSS